MQTDKPVPIVDFYGEAHSWSTPEFVHSEPLIERSQLHDWKIKPHRHSNLMQLFLLQTGSGAAHLDATRYELVPHCVLVVPERCVHGFKWAQDSSGYALSIASPLVDELRSSLGGKLSDFRQPEIIDVTADHIFIARLFAEIDREQFNNLPLKAHLLDSLIKTLAIRLVRLSTQRVMQADLPDRANKHFSRFTRLVDQHFRTHRSIASYANELGITPSHLNTICNKISNKPALAVVHERLLLAAKRDLTYTEKSISGVSHALGFTDPCYFTRFFKRHTDLTPKQYRRQSGTLAGTS